jgi:2-keto-4-pentenoate hydratase
MDKKSISRAAALLWDTLKSNSQIDTLPANCRPQNITDGYLIQDQLEKISGLSVTGYKVGATNARVQNGFGIDSPFYGRLYNKFIYKEPASIPRGIINSYAIEPEFDFIISKDMPPREVPYTKTEIVESIESVHPAIEIPDSRYKDWFKVKAPDLIADNAISGVLVLGPAEPKLRTKDLSDQTVEVLVNGDTAGHGIGSNVLGGPWNVLTWLINNLNSKGVTVNSGSLITTGSASDVIYCKPGDKVECNFGELGTISVEFE